MMNEIQPIQIRIDDGRASTDRFGAQFISPVLSYERRSFSPTAMVMTCRVVSECVVHPEGPDKYIFSGKLAAELTSAFWQRGIPIRVAGQIPPPRGGLFLVRHYDYTVQAIQAAINDIRKPQVLVVVPNAEDATRWTNLLRMGRSKRDVVNWYRHRGIGYPNRPIVVGGFPLLDLVTAGMTKCVFVPNATPLISAHYYGRSRIGGWLQRYAILQDNRVPALGYLAPSTTLSSGERLRMAAFFGEIRDCCGEGVAGQHEVPPSEW